MYQFRLASLGIHATLWTVLGLGFGAVAERLLLPAAGRTTGISAEERGAQPVERPHSDPYRPVVTPDGRRA